jgi:aquaporin Z
VNDDMSRPGCHRVLWNPLAGIGGCGAAVLAAGFPNLEIGFLGVAFAFGLINPARSTGPALFAGGEYIAQLWLFLVAPIIGTVIAGLLTRWMYEPEAIVETVVLEERRVSS